MRFDLLTVLKHFSVDGSRLYRRRADGTCKLVTTVESGRLVSSVGGVKYWGPDIAWAIHYLVVPQFPVVAIDMNPHNLELDNLGAAHPKRLVLRLNKVGDRWRHSLCGIGVTGFRTPEEAQADWVDRAKGFYRAALPYVKQVQGLGLAPSEVPVIAARPVRVAKAPQHPSTPPDELPGRIWKLFKGAWVAIPYAVHPSDDWMVRAEVITRNPNARFVYDPLADKTLTVE